MQLRDYQQKISAEACNLLHQYKIAYLSMQVRTGKTITALNTAKLYGAKIVLFVTKKKAIGSIEADYLSAFKDDYTLYCVNYESVHKLPQVAFDLVILDESHALGQFPVPSNRAKDLKKLCKDLPIIYLSGTPSPESYSQLFHQFWISSYTPFVEPTFYKWATNSVTIGIKHMYNRQIKDYTNANKTKIDERTAHLFISFTQEQAGFEQLIDEEVHTITMKPVTYQMAKHLRTHRVIVFKDGRELTADTEVKLMQKLHQIYSGSVKHECGTSREFDTSKIEYIARNFATQKIAIFYKFIAEKNIITAYLQGLGIAITESPEFFNANPDCVFISQIQSGREGINLSSADCLIMYNIDFSAVSYWQARARLQTKNRTKIAKVHWIFAMDGIEPKIYGAVSKKKDYTLRYFKKDFAE